MTSKNIVKQWKNNWSDYVIQFLLLGLFLSVLTIFLSNSLTPRTNIKVELKLSKLLNVSADYNLDLIFNNKANFAGEEFYIYIWGINSNSWGSSHATSEHCKRDKEIVFDKVKFYCDFIPPKSKFGFGVDFELNDIANDSKIIYIEYWGKTTPYKKEYYNIIN